MAAAELPVESFADQSAFREWLRGNVSTSPGVWVKLAKKGSAHTTVTYAEAVEVALCFGWIDSQARRLDDDFRLQRFTPRRARSPWSKRNREAVENLTERGLMEAEGFAAVDAAKSDGRWERAYAGPKDAQVPPDLLAALAANPAAEAFFATLDSRNRFAALYRIQDAKRPETRARRIASFVEQFGEGRKFYG
ncbi:YdeI/OmpD-associated family protein [Prescottella defluvii]|uniref:YdeI/OmpD-associated family protein n=1 Tax=Prescottella defluvii TaxID=1323361 RepID=UPI0004F2ED3B|nr:YdeI/OmpD-associated family protein [Prescottella defluvii]